MSDEIEASKGDLTPWYRGKTPRSFDGFPREDSEQVYDSVWCGLRRDMIRLPNGDLQDYHIFEVTDAIVVVPVLPDGSILMIWQYRYPHGKSHWEIPAGRMHADEDPVDAADRELLEETGYASDSVEKLCGFYPINGISAHYAHAFVARDCEWTSELKLDHSELLEVHRFEPDEVRGLLLRGEIQDGFTALALHAYFAASAVVDPVQTK
ncbi:MAG: 8-oxo-dGTP pyrophosphatase MutT (NUDIX family) [Planctomycetota bacterium]